MLRDYQILCIKKLTDEKMRVILNIDDGDINPLTVKRELIDHFEAKGAYYRPEDLMIQAVLPVYSPVVIPEEFK